MGQPLTVLCQIEAKYLANDPPRKQTLKGLATAIVIVLTQ